jgi:hypothetical protein
MSEVVLRAAPYPSVAGDVARGRLLQLGRSHPMQSLLQSSLLGLPDVLTPVGETERLEPHRLKGNVAGEDQEVGPGEFPALILLDRP